MSIVNVIQKYYPEWQPPPEGRGVWAKCLCPFHGDETPSASISFEYDAFVCHACGMKGNAVSIIKQQEGIRHGDAKRIAAGLSVGGDNPVQRELPRKSSRRVFGGSRAEPSQDSGVRPGIRGRSTPWT